MGKKCDQVRKSFQTFCDGTSMHGFVELFHAKTTYWLLFWSLLLATAIGLTAYQVIKAVQQFMDQTSASRTEIVEQNDMYPPIKICSMHWVYWLDWDKAYSLNFTKDGVLYGMSYLTEIYTEDLYNITKAKDQFQSAMALNKFTIIQQFYYSVAKDFTIIDTPSSFTPSPAFDQHEVSVSRYWGPLMCYVLSGEVILQTMRKNQNRTEYLEIFLALKTNVASLNYSGVSLLEYGWYMSQFLSSSGMYADPNMIYSTTDFSTFSLPFLLFVDGYSQDYIAIRDEDDAYTVTVSVTANKWIPNPSYNCLKGKKCILSDPSFCQNCKLLYPDKTCKCLDISQAIRSKTDYPQTLCQYPIYQSTNHNATRVFPGRLIEKDEDCWINETAMQLRESCPECTLPCEQWQYSFSFLAEKWGTPQNYFTKTATGVRVVYPNDYSICLIVEVERQTWEDFVANIGGLLGVWTGASIMSIVQLFYLCCLSHIEPKRIFKKNNIDNVTPWNNEEEFSKKEISENVTTY